MGPIVRPFRCRDNRISGARKTIEITLLPDLAPTSRSKSNGVAEVRVKTFKQVLCPGQYEP